jgi:ABC-2 type transport system permease protein
VEIASMALLPIYSIWLRDLRRFVRQRSRVVGALATPVLFWFVLGSGLGRSFSATDDTSGGGGYLEYYFAGTIALIVLFTSIFSTISIIEDRREGFLQGVLASPASRTSIVLGKVLGSTTLAMINAAIFLVLAPFAGVALTPLSIVSTLLIVAILGIGLSGLGVLIAWSLESTQGFHAIMNLVLVPMWLLSGAFFPASGAAPWVRALMTINPLTYGVTALRDVVYDGRLEAASSQALVVAVGFAIVMVGLATALASRPMRS